MTMKHTVKASGINDAPFTTANGIAGMYFKVEGNAATSRQFYVTDSIRHFSGAHSILTAHLMLIHFLLLTISWKQTCVI